MRCIVFKDCAAMCLRGQLSNVFAAPSTRLHFAAGLQHCHQECCRHRHSVVQARRAVAGQVGRQLRSRVNAQAGLCPPGTGIPAVPGSCCVWHRSTGAELMDERRLGRSMRPTCILALSIISASAAFLSVCPPLAVYMANKDCEPNHACPLPHNLAVLQLWRGLVGLPAGFSEHGDI